MNFHHGLRRALCCVIAAATIAAGAVTGYASDGIDRLGDIDGDGTVTSSDALLILRHSVGLDQLDDDVLEYADLDGDGVITSSDALAALQMYFAQTEAVIDFPDKLTVCCGDRIDNKAKMLPEDLYGSVKFKYLVGLQTSNDGQTDEDGEPYKVLDITNTGRIKAFHPGVATIKVVADNGVMKVCTVTVKDMITTKTITSGNQTLKVTSHMMTKNDCYNETDDFTQVDGVVVHSTATPGAMADVWYSAWNRRYTDAAVHSFLDNKGVYNYLPLDQTAWHAGQPANKTYLDFEICEPGTFSYSGNTITGYSVAENQAYFDAIWKNATLYTAYLCDLNDLTADDVISHHEAALLGIGTNHGDPDHWFPLHGKDMDDFRADVAKLLKQGITVSERTIVSSGYAESGAAEECDENDDFDMEAFYEHAMTMGGDGWRY